MEQRRIITDEQAETDEAEREQAEFERARQEEADRHMATVDRRTRYNMKNRAKRAADAAKVRAGPAAPPWLTPEHDAEIVAIYQQAILWTEATGIPHEVDHLVPLAASHNGVHYLCGLHIPRNLRAIPKHLNRERSNWFPTVELLIEPEVDPLDVNPFDGDVPF
ncbi:hypothetical protein GC209_18040 [bacterium]|nr:hypothetical protein [bacterium]